MYVFSLKPFSGFITVYALYFILPETSKFWVQCYCGSGWFRINSQLWIYLMLNIVIEKLPYWKAH